MKTKIYSVIAPHLKPIYERLCTKELLSRCLGTKTQNNNESYHSMIWHRCKKVVPECYLYMVTFYNVFFYRPRSMDSML